MEMIFAVQASTQTPDVKKQIEAQSRELSSRPSKWIKSPEEDIRQLVWLVIFCSGTYKFPLAACRPIQINSPKCRRTPEGHSMYASPTQPRFNQQPSISYTNAPRRGSLDVRGDRFLAGN
jgi:hypothetical protein